MRRKSLTWGVFWDIEKKMKQKHPFLLIIRVSFQDQQIFNRSLDGVLKEIEELPFPVHWNLPVRPLTDDQSSSLLDGLRHRLTKDSPDILLPMGYTGVHHPLLRFSHLKKEVSWTFSNPWKNGIIDKRIIHQDILMPLAPDFQRPAVKGYYHDKHRWLFPMRNATGRILLYKEGRNSGALPLIHVPQPDGGWIQSLFRTLKNSPAALLLDCTNGRDHLQTFIELLKGKPSKLPLHIGIHDIAHVKSHSIAHSIGRFPDVKEFLLTGNTDEIDRSRGTGSRNLWQLTFDPVPNTPGDRFNRYRNMRMKNSKRGDRGTLAALTGLITRADTENHSPPPNVSDSPSPSISDRRLLADMTGSVVLEEDGMTVHFERGSFSGITNGNRALLPPVPVATGIMYGKTLLRAKRESSFSFEGSFTRGLRESLFLPMPWGGLPAGIARDYYFIEDFPRLIVSVKNTWPGFPGDERVDGILAGEFHLFSLEGERGIQITGKAPSGDEVSFELPPEEGTFQIPAGEITFRYRGTAITITFIASPVLSLIPLRIHRKGRSLLCSINPGGFYKESEYRQVLPVSERYSMVILARSEPGGDNRGGAMSTIPPLTKTILSEIGNPWMEELTQTHH